MTGFEFEAILINLSYIPALVDELNAKHYIIIFEYCRVLT